MPSPESKSSRAALALLGVALFAALAATCADAQYQGRQRGQRGGDARDTRDAHPGASSLVVDPAAAIERELPSLRADLKLSAEQAALWTAFERRVRDAGEASRTQSKYLATLRAEKDQEKDKDKFRPGHALAVLSALADIDAKRGEAMRDAALRLQALEEKLTPEQNTLIDKRLPLSLTDPLGNS